MIRTQISLDKREYSLVKMEAKSPRISVAGFVRRAIQQSLRPHGEGEWIRFTGFIEAGNPRSVRSIDEIVYGHED